MKKIFGRICMVLCLTVSVHAMDKNKEKRKTKKELKMIREAVFARNGLEYERKFKTLYPKSSEREAIREAAQALAREFDSDWYAMRNLTYWQGMPQELVVKINGEEYGIASHILQNVIITTKSQVRMKKGLL